MIETTLTAEPSKQEVVITRVFEAPLDLVFKVVTDPAQIPNWWGPRELTTTVDEMDVQAGGKWRFLHTDPDGNHFGFHGVYHEVDSPKRIVQTFEFEGMPGHVVLETGTFEALPGGKTKLTSVSVFQSIEDRDGMVASGMERGTKESSERLDELLTSMLSKKA